ncbi:MAG: sigma-54-dependent Fis family transcriptional regulator [Candidatus Latescibacteria bacterium]|nr:sigma-54-dependent Fis family transcriptional regulator [Candidatus Latescibacterota bacterium]
MSKSLPPHFNLRQLKIQAKELLKAYQTRDPEALARYRQHHPQHQKSSDPRLIEAGLTLQDAQLVMAREYGFDSWPRLTAAIGDAPTSRAPADGFVGNSPAADRIRAEMDRAAANDLPVLILGEKGVGKRLVARTIHALSRRSAGPLLHLTCDAANGLLCESELLGYEPGAFTGANTSQAGSLQLAEGGTLVLEEIGDLQSAAQAKLRHFVERGVYRRLGGTQDLAADTRLLGTSSRDLALLVKSGSFREDLYYQFQVLCIELPPLRDRVEDIPTLANFCAMKLGTGHRETPRFSPDALALLRAHSWPGHVRELKSTVERAVAEATGETIAAAAIRIDSPANTQAE